MSKATRLRFHTLSTSSVGIAVLLVVGLATLSGCEERSTTEATTTPGEYVPAGHAHDKAGETCFICDASKRDKGRMWCKEHARYEDRCWDCHPEARDSDRAYCEKHHLYQDECHLCGTEAKGGTP